MKFILAAVILIILSGCYTQVVNKINVSDKYLPISDTTTFLPDENYLTSVYNIKDLYGKWINSRKEENSVIKIYRKKNYEEFPQSRFRNRINFYLNGECEYLVLLKGDRQEYVKTRWRLLKENTNIVYLYDEKGRKDRSFRIEELRDKILKLVWLK